MTLRSQARDSFVKQVGVEQRVDPSHSELPKKDHKNIARNFLQLEVCSIIRGVRSTWKLTDDISAKKFPNICRRDTRSRGCDASWRALDELGGCHCRHDEMTNSVSPPTLRVPEGFFMSCDLILPCFTRRFYT